MQFEKLNIFPKRPTRWHVPKVQWFLPTKKRKELENDILELSRKDDVMRWLHLEKRYAFGDLKPAHSELVQANAIISSVVDMWPGRDHWSLSTYFKTAKDWEIAILRAAASYLATPDTAEAEAIAKRFRLGTQLQKTRQQLLVIKQVWSDFEARADAYIAAVAAYKLGKDAQHSIYETLQKTTAVDVQLWHEIVTDTNHMTTDRLQSIDWIFQQAECDQATVAAFLYIAHEFSLWEEIESFEQEKFLQLTQVINRWNDGFYEYCNLPMTSMSLQERSDPTDFPVDYSRFWQSAFPNLAAQLPVPKARNLKKPNKSALKIYAKNSGFSYNVETGHLMFCKGHPKKGSFFEV